MEQLRSHKGGASKVYLKEEKGGLKVTWGGAEWGVIWDGEV